VLASPVVIRRCSLSDVVAAGRLGLPLNHEGRDCVGLKHIGGC